MDMHRISNSSSILLCEKVKSICARVLAALASWTSNWTFCNPTVWVASGCSSSTTPCARARICHPRQNIRNRKMNGATLPNCNTTMSIWFCFGIGTIALSRPQQAGSTRSRMILWAKTSVGRSVHHVTPYNSSRLLDTPCIVYDHIY